MKTFLYLCAFCIFANAKFIGDAGYGYNFYRYQEPGLMKIEGMLHTIFAKLAYIDIIGVEANYLQAFNANLKYDGSTQSGTPLINIPSRDKFYDFDFKLGTRFGLFEEYDGFGYIGIGYRYLDNRISGSGGYRREQVYYYIPIGFHASDSMPIDDLFARYGLELRYMFLGINKTHIGEAIPNINPSVLEMEQGSSFGLRVHAGFEYFLANYFKIFTQFSIDYWYIRESSTGITTRREDRETILESWVEPKKQYIPMWHRNRHRILRYAV